MENLSFRKILIIIKQQNKNNASQFLGITGAVFTTLLILSLLVDGYTPFFGVWMFVRAFILIPLSISIFVLGYSLSIYLGKLMKTRNPEWVPIRMRFSPTWRNRISIIIGAFLLLIMYTYPEQVGYTFVSSSLIAIVISLFVFMRKTKREKEMAELGIPDERDVSYQKLVEELEEDQKKQKLIELQKKSKKKYERWGIKDENYVDEIDEEEYKEIDLDSTPEGFDFEIKEIDEEK